MGFIGSNNQTGNQLYDLLGIKPEHIIKYVIYWVLHTNRKSFMGLIGSYIRTGNQV